jgi:hypothetical protein
LQSCRDKNAWSGQCAVHCDCSARPANGGGLCIKTDWILLWLAADVVDNAQKITLAASIARKTNGVKGVGNTLHQIDARFRLTHRARPQMPPAYASR